MDTMRNIGHAIFRSLSDEDKVVKYDKPDKKEIVVEQKVGHVADGALEKLSNIAQYGCSLAGTGAHLTGILGKAGTVIDATRVFEHAEWFLTTKAKFKDEDGNFTFEYIKDFAIHSSFFMMGALSAGVALFEFNIVDLSWIGDSIGSIASYGGLGFIFAGGAIPLIHAGVGIGVAICFVSGVLQLWKDHENMGSWQFTFTVLKLVGNVAEVSLRIVAISTGTSPVVIPVLGIISNTFGYFYILSETVAQNELANECTITYDKKTGQVTELKLDNTSDKKTGQVTELKLDNTSLDEVKEPKSKKVNPLWTPILFFQPAITTAAGVFASIKGTDKLAKISVVITELVAPHFKALISVLKSYRLVSCGIGFCGTISRHMESEESRGKFLDEAWADIKKFELRRIAEAFLFAAQLADLGKLIAKASGCSGELGTFTLFGVPGRISFSSLKPTFLAGFLIITMIKESMEIWDLYNDKDTTAEVYDNKLPSFVFKFGLSAGKVGVILLSGGFILFAGYSSAVWFGVAQVGVFGLDLVDWVYKDVFNKPASQKFKVAR